MNKSELVKEMGVEAADIETQQINTYQMQEQEIRPGLQMMPAIDGGRIKLGQWNASNSTGITLRDVSKAGQLTDLLNASGATNIYGPNFQLDTSKQADDKLMGLAVADARKKAEVMAAASGAKLGRVISIVEGGESSPIYPVMMRAEAKLADINVPAPVEVGSTKISKTVTVVWSLR